MLAETQQKILLCGQDLGQLWGTQAWWNWGRETQAWGWNTNNLGFVKSSTTHLCHLDFAICIFVVFVHELLHLVTQIVLL